MENFLTNYEFSYLNQIIAELYDEQDTTVAYRNFLEKLNQLVYFEKGDIYFYYNRPGNFKMTDFIFWGWNEPELNKYLDYYYTIDDVLPIVASNYPTMFRCSDIFIQYERKKTRYYKELIEIVGMHYSLEGNIFIKGDDFYGGLGLHRSDKNKNFTLKELNIIKNIRPHLENIAKRHIVKKKNQENNINLYNSDILKTFKHFSNIHMFIMDENLKICWSSLENDNNLEKDIEQMMINKIKELCNNILRNKERDNSVIRAQINIDNQFYFAEVLRIQKENHMEGNRLLVVLSNIAGIMWEIIREIKCEYKLTEREYEILKLVLMGYDNNEISKEIYISLSTVKKHLANIYDKLGIKNKNQIFNVIMYT